MALHPWIKIPCLLKDSRHGKRGDEIVDLEKALKRVGEGRYQSAGPRLRQILTSEGLIEMRVFRKVRKLRSTVKTQKDSSALRGLSCRMSPRRPGTGGKPGDSEFERLLDDLASGDEKRRSRANEMLNSGWR